MTVHLEEEISLFIIKVFLESPHDSLLVSVFLFPSIEDGTPHRPSCRLPRFFHLFKEYMVKPVSSFEFPGMSKLIMYPRLTLSSTLIAG